MKKDQLQLGMVVEVRDNHRFFLVSIKDVPWLIGDVLSLPLEHYFSDLYCKGDSDRDIMKVYQVKSFYGILDIIKDSSLELIWERKEPVEITMDQIAEKFGIPVELIKIKEG